MGRIIPYIMENKMFQTTNQFVAGILPNDRKVYV